MPLLPTGGLRNIIGGSATGAGLGALSGGISNYMAEGDLDHAIRGAVVGAGMGGLSGAYLGGVNRALSAGVSAATPALLAQQKDRPILRELFSPDAGDLGSELYSEKNRFNEGSAEWQDYYAKNPDRYAANYGEPEQEKEAMIKKASMTLEDIAYMEKVSGQNVGRVATSVGTIIDSGGNYTLYDNSGEYTYGTFNKLAEAEDYAEKLAEYFTQINDGTAQVMRKGRFPWSRATRVAEDPSLYKARGWTNKARMADRLAYEKTLRQAQTTGLLQTQQMAQLPPQSYNQGAMGNIKTTGARGPDITALGSVGNKPAVKGPDITAMGQVKATPPPAQEAAKVTPPTNQSQARVVRSGNRGGVNPLDRLSSSGKKVTKPAVEVAQKVEQAVVPKVVQQAEQAAAPQAAKALGRWGKAGLGGLAAAGLGYLGYQAFKPEETYWDKAKDYATTAATAINKYGPQIQRAANLMGARANAGGNYSHMGYQAPQRQYPQQYQQAAPQQYDPYQIM
tara:strand:- start:15708 stop:17228 length:1521 start_codon:yes stop_codon:yes gene_type:complete